MTYITLSTNPHAIAMPRCQVCLSQLPVLLDNNSTLCSYKHAQHAQHAQHAYHITLRPPSLLEEIVDGQSTLNMDNFKKFGTAFT